MKAGLWHKRLADMTSDSELEAYAFFVFALDDARRMALKLEK